MLLAQDPARSAAAQISREQLETGEVAFQVQVPDEPGERLGEAVTRVVESGTVDVGKLVIDQPSGQQFNFDVSTRYQFGPDQATARITRQAAAEPLPPRQASHARPRVPAGCRPPPLQRDRDDGRSPASGGAIPSAGPSARASVP